MRKKLTAKFVENGRCQGPRRLEVYDLSLPAFGLRVSYSGVKTWFCVKRRALQKCVDEDKAPRGVTPESVEAIDHARKIGNIGAHMEKDINLIIDIDPEEAQILIELVENLFDE